MPQNDKDGKTYFVTAAHADNYLRLIKTTVDDCHAIALMTDGVQDNVYDDSSCLVKPVVVKLADEFTEGRQAGEKAVLETIEKYIVAGSNMSDDASFGVMLFDGTRAPDAAACMTQAGVCGKSSESFAELMKAIRPELVKAHEIIAHKSSDAASDSAAQNVKTEKDSADESKQGESTYTEFARLAREEGFDEVADWFETLSRAERAHAERFKRMYESLFGNQSGITD